MKHILSPNNSTGVYVKGYKDSGSDNFMLGCRNGGGNTRWAIGKISTSGWYYGWGKFESSSIEGNPAEIYLNYKNDRLFKVTATDGTKTLNLSSLSFTPYYNIRLFGSAGVNDTYTKWNGRIYAVQITQGTEIIMDLIPVRVGNVGYMYDKVSGELFGNDGSGEFILGKDVELYDEFKTDVCEVHPKLIANTYINENTGAQQNYGGWSSSDYIDVEGFNYIQVPYPFSKSNYKYGAYYDKDKKRISNTASLTIPSNAKYVRLSTTTGGFTNVWLFKRQFTQSKAYQTNHYIETDGSIRAYNGWNIFNTESVYNYFYCWIYEQSYRYQASYNADGSVYQSGNRFLEKPKYGKVLLSDNHTSITYYAGYNYEYKNMNE